MTWDLAVNDSSECGLGGQLAEQLLVAPANASAHLWTQSIATQRLSVTSCPVGDSRCAHMPTYTLRESAKQQRGVFVLHANRQTPQVQVSPCLCPFKFSFMHVLLD